MKKIISLLKKGSLVLVLTLFTLLNIVNNVTAGNSTVAINSQGRILYIDEKTGKSVLLDAEDFKHLTDKITKVEGELIQIDDKINNLENTIQNEVKNINNVVNQLEADVNIKVERWDADTQTLYLVPVE